MELKIVFFLSSETIISLSSTLENSFSAPTHVHLNSHTRDPENLIANKKSIENYYSKRKAKAASSRIEPSPQLFRIQSGSCNHKKKIKPENKY